MAVHVWRRCAVNLVFVLAFVSGSASAQSGGNAATQFHQEAEKSSRDDRDLCRPRLVFAEPPLGEALGRFKKCRPGGSSSGIAKGDFNGDGFADLAVGVPEENTPASQPDAGAVIVIYGSATGLNAVGGAGIPASQFWSQNTPGVPGGSEAGDAFGSALAAGDFNGDPFSDLAVGVPFEDLNGNPQTGAVIVIYGSSQGLSVNASQSPRFFNLFQNLAGERWGHSLAWGDFNGDAIGDLVVGAPGFSLSPPFPSQPIPRVGLVQVLFGSDANGLTTSGSQFFSQSIIGNNPAEADDIFGHALAAGDFNGDTISDLAIGVPGEDIGSSIQNQGAVQLLLGRDGSGLTTTNNRLLFISSTQRPPGIPGPASNDQFGLVLATGDFDGEGTSDLVIGVPDKQLIAGNAAGGAYVFAGSTTSTPLGGGVQYWDQNRIFGAGNENGDKFGNALAAGDFDADGFADLAIGAPLENVGAVADAGAVYAIYGSAAGLAITGRSPQSWHQNVLGVEDTIETGDQFGSSLTAWNFGRNEGPIKTPVEIADLAIGAPLENVGSIADAGAVNVLYGASNGGLSSANDQIWTQSSGGVPGGPEAGDHFGKAVY